MLKPLYAARTPRAEGAERVKRSQRGNKDLKVRGPLFRMVLTSSRRRPGSFGLPTCVLNKNLGVASSRQHFSNPSSCQFSPISSSHQLLSSKLKQCSEKYVSVKPPNFGLLPCWSFIASVIASSSISSIFVCLDYDNHLIAFPPCSPFYS